MFSNKKILTITGVAILLGAGGIYFLNSQSRNIQTNTPSSSINKKITAKADNNFEGLKIEDLISYSLPENWQKMNKRVDSYLSVGNQGSIPYAHYIQYTPLNDTSTSKTNDIRVHIEVKKKEMSNVDYMSTEKLSNGYSNEREITIDKAKAIQAHYDDSNQGHFLEYRFIHLDLPWRIWIQTKDLASEKTHQKDIDSFINSIKLIDQ